MIAIVEKFMKERFEAVVGHRHGQRWDEARSTLGEIEKHAQELEPEVRGLFEQWVEIHRHLVEAARLSATFQDDAELARLSKARYGLEKLPIHDLDPDSEARLQVEYLHADIAWAELTVALRVQGFDDARRAALVQKQKALLETAMKRGQQLALRRLVGDERFERLPYWIRQIVTRSHLAMVFTLVESDGGVLNEPTTLVARMASLLARDGDPNVWLKPLFEDKDFVGSYVASARSAVDEWLKKPAAAELKAWLEQLWAAGLSAERYETLMADVQAKVGRGMLECFPYFKGFADASRPEHRARECAKLIDKLAEQVYKPELQVLFKLTKDRDDNIPSYVRQLTCDLRNIWQDRGPVKLLDDDAGLIRNAECHAKTVHAPWGATVTFTDANGHAVLGPMSGEELERRLERFVDRVMVIHLCACYVRHPDAPNPVGNRLAGGTGRAE